MPSVKSVLLLSCSHTKKAGGREFDATARQLRPLLIKGGEALTTKRRYIFDLLKGKGDRLYDQERQGGFRDLRRSNRSLFPGPDFGYSTGSRPAYLPAYERYDGRFFTALTEKAPCFWQDISQHPVEVIFVSALYGLLLWDEEIQDYDCHLTDRDGAEHTLRDIWGNTLTIGLAEAINQMAAEERPIIFDLLSEEDYQRTFDWDRVKKRTGADILHRVFRNAEGPDILSELADILAFDLKRFYSDAASAARFADRTWYKVPGTGREFRFERYVFGELNAVQQALKEAHPALAYVPRESLQDLALAETFWLRLGKSRNVPPGAIVVSFANALEAYIRVSIPLLNHMLGLGDAVGWARENIPNLVDPLRDISLLRNRAAHGAGEEARRRKLTREDAENCRALVFQIFNRLLQQNT